MNAQQQTDLARALAASQAAQAKAKLAHAAYEAAQQANARLIAAAPDLLAALVDCQEALRRAGASGELEIVKAAIKKATGGKP